MVKYKNFLIMADDDGIRIQNTQTGAKKAVKIATDKYCDFIFKCLKTQIRTQYTTQGFLDWMQSLIDKDFCTAYISAICDKYDA